MTIDQAGSASPLATAEQIEAERTVLELKRELGPEIARIEASIRAELAETPRGQSRDGAATLDAAIRQWTNSLIYTEVSNYRPQPSLVWATDDSTRTWLGHTIGAATSVYNPDGIFRQVALDGSHQYEISGRFDQANRPAQLVIEEFRDDLTHSGRVTNPPAADGEIPKPPILITDRDLTIEADGSFRIVFGGAPTGATHVPTRPGPYTLLLRDMLSDWTQRPCRLSIRRLDGPNAKPFDLAELRARVLADLRDFILYWAKYPDSFFGLSQANVVSSPMGREGGWGMIAGLRFDLAPGEAMLVTTARGGAAYTGFQLLDPWMVAGDPRDNQVCLNLSQSTANADGTYSYVISPTDPGVANWLDTAGLHEGLGFIRWQALPPGATNAGLLLDSRVIRLADLSDMIGVPRLSPEQRAAQQAARVESYNSRAL